MPWPGQTANCSAGVRERARVERGGRGRGRGRGAVPPDGDEAHIEQVPVVDVQRGVPRLLHLLDSARAAGGGALAERPDAAGGRAGAGGRAPLLVLRHGRLPILARPLIATPHTAIGERPAGAGAGSGVRVRVCVCGAAAGRRRRTSRGSGGSCSSRTTPGCRARSG